MVIVPNFLNPSRLHRPKEKFQLKSQRSLTPLEPKYLEAIFLPNKKEFLLATLLQYKNLF